MKNVGPFPKITGVYMHMFLLHLHVILQFLFICFLPRLPLDFALLPKTNEIFISCCVFSAVIAEQTTESG